MVANFVCKVSNKMKLHWFRLIGIWDFERHEAWLSEQARKGLHYDRRLFGFDRFKADEPAEFIFCWDRSPL